MATMESPYANASRMAFDLSLLRFKKKDTVIGMMGHTQGVKIARKPPSKPSKNIVHKDKEAVSVVPLKVCSSVMTGFQSCFNMPVAESVVVSAATFSLCFSMSFVLMLSAEVFVSAAASVAKTVLFPLYLQSTSEGGRHSLSLQAPYSR